MIYIVSKSIENNKREYGNNFLNDFPINLKLSLDCLELDLIMKVLKSAFYIPFEI